MTAMKISSCRKGPLLALIPTTTATTLMTYPCQRDRHLPKARPPMHRPVQEAARHRCLYLYIFTGRHRSNHPFHNLSIRTEFRNCHQVYRTCRACTVHPCLPLRHRLNRIWAGERTIRTAPPGQALPSGPIGRLSGHRIGAEVHTEAAHNGMHLRCRIP